MFKVERGGEEVRVLTHNNDRCVGCGICVNVCPTESLRLGPIVPIARGLIEMELVSVNESSCVLCGLCSVACPFDSLSLAINGEPIKELNNYPKWDIISTVDEEKCIYCGRCNIACPREAILFERHLPKREDLVRGQISIDDDKCIYCRMCAEMCPSEAIFLKCDGEDSQSELDNTIGVDRDKCVYCGVCKRICPEGAIKTICSTCMERDEIPDPVITGKTYIIDKDCVNCTWCMDVCPVDAIEIIKPFTGIIEMVETEEAKCKGESCHACQDVCPCNAITIIDNKAFTDPKFCNLCGACIPACPQHIRHLDRKSMQLSNIKSLSWSEYLNKILE